jgi:2,3-dihydroxybenzoate decarboxylase
MAKKSRIIAIEEHYLDAEVKGHLSGEDATKAPWVAERLDNLSNLRIKEMDECGIDMQVLSHGAPALQKLSGDTAVRLARGANDRLHEACERHPERFAAFACLPTNEPKEAADELERTVTKYGFKGAMMHGLSNGLFLDDKRFWPIFERAAALDVPLYMHPANPSPAVVEAYYKDYAKDFPLLLRAGWGFTVETATQGIRIVLSGLLEKYPKLKIILGHLGEGLPFMLWRIDSALSREGNRALNFRELFCKHFWITTSGFFSNPALLCCVQEMGVDRIIFSVDYPFVPNPPATNWIATIPLCTEDKEKILHGNVERLLKL